MLQFFSVLRANCQAVDSTFGEPYSFFDEPFYLPGATGCDFEGRTDRAYSMLVLEDGKFILAGHSVVPGDGDFAFVRLLPDGKFDQTAGPDGEVQLDLGFQNDSCIAASLYQSNKILMGGCVTLFGQTGYATLLALTDIDGNLDAAFGSQGHVVLDLPGSRDMITEIAPLPDGSIIIAGNMFYGPSYQYPDSTVIFIGKLLANGQVDSSFGNNGFTFQRFNICAS